jgi:hypothetical protein
MLYSEQIAAWVLGGREECQAASWAGPQGHRLPRPGSPGGGQSRRRHGPPGREQGSECGGFRRASDATGAIAASTPRRATPDRAACGSVNTDRALPPSSTRRREDDSRRHQLFRNLREHLSTHVRASAREAQPSSPNPRRRHPACSPRPDLS